MILWLAFALAAGQPNPARAQLRTCAVQGQPARCGTIDVLEEARNPAGHRLSLGVIVLPRTGAGQAMDPIFVLAGGPGQAATSLTGWVAQSLAPARRSRDVVLLDQRGTGGDTRLDCARAPGAFFVPLDPERCAATLGRGAVLAQYGTENFIDDLERARQALGYARIVLYGLSYGSRAAYAYARKYQDHVSAAVLAAPAPVAMPLLDSFAEDGRASLAAVTADCETDADCFRAFPRLRADIATVTARLSIARALGLQLLQYSSTGLAHVPLLITRAAAGNWEPFDSAVSAARADVDGQIALGVHLTIICGEDVPFGRTDSRTVIREQYARACRNWPRAPLPADFHTPAQLPVRALVIVGEWDPVTPPRWARAAADQFSPAQVVPLAKASHIPAGYETCIGTLVESFLEAGRADAACATVAHRPSYALR